MSERTVFTRRTSNLSNECKSRLPENQFWAQTQGTLSELLLQSSYNENLYVPIIIPGSVDISKDIFDFAKTQSDPTCYLLVGQYGAGKTTALKHFEYRYINNNEDPSYKFLWIYVNLEGFQTKITRDKNRLEKEILNCTVELLTKYLTSNKKNRENYFDDLLINDSSFNYINLLENNRKKAIENVKLELKENVSLGLVTMLRFLSRQKGITNVLIAIDNVDSLSRTTQLEAVKFLTQICLEGNVKGIITIRRDTEAWIRYHNSSILGTLVRNEIRTPTIIDVVKKRISEALKESKIKNAKIGEGANQYYIRDCPEFTEVLLKGLNQKAIKKLLDGLSNGSVQQGLSLAVKIYASHFIDAKRIIRKLSPVEQVVPSIWMGHIPYYIVVKAIMLCNYPVYQPNTSKIGNIFGTEKSDTHIGPFLRIFILQFVKKFYPSSISIDEIKEKLVPILNISKNQLDYEIAWLINQNWLESFEESLLGISVLGKFMLEEFIYDIEYLTHISTDVDMVIEYEQKIVAPAETIVSRLSNLNLLLEFLINQEIKMFIKLSENGLNSYAEIFDDYSITPRIVRNVKNQLEVIISGDQEEDNIFDAISETISSVNKLGVKIDKIYNFFNKFQKRNIDD